MSEEIEKRKELFYKTAYLRHKIYCKKEAGLPKPWTTNPVFQQHYFCNVFRDFDKTSKWIIQYIITPFEDTESLWKYIMFARCVNSIEIFREIEKEFKGPIPDCSLEMLKKYLKKRKSEGKSVIGNAFILNSKIKGGWTDKITYIFDTIKYVEKMYQDTDKFLQKTFLQAVYEDLLDVPGIGPFMAYQYAIDFSYSKRYLKDAPDIYDWTSLGLGAMRGMSRILYGNPNEKKPKLALEFSKDLLTSWKEYVNQTIDKEAEATINEAGEEHRTFILKNYFRFLDLKMSDVEHWLCEFDKYCRGGSGKRKYPGG